MFPVENSEKKCAIVLLKWHFFTFRNLIEAMQAERQVRVSGVILENPAVCSGATVYSQAGFFVPAHQRLRLCLLTGFSAQTGAARTQLPQDELTDAKVEAQNHDVDDVDQQQTGSVVPGNRDWALRSIPNMEMTV